MQIWLKHVVHTGGGEKGWGLKRWKTRESNRFIWRMSKSVMKSVSPLKRTYQIKVKDLLNLKIFISYVCTGTID